MIYGRIREKLDLWSEQGLNSVQIMPKRREKPLKSKWAAEIPVENIRAETKVNTFSYTVCPEQYPWGAQIRDTMSNLSGKQCGRIERDDTNKQAQHLPVEVTIWGITSSNVLQSPLGKPKKKDMTSVVTVMPGDASEPRGDVVSCSYSQLAFILIS